jgi:hypothetical protein
MSSYQGPAVIVLDTGQEFDVTANLISSPDRLRTSWQGTLSVPDVSKPIELMNLSQGTLRVGEREGAFVRPDISDWLSSPNGRFQITVLGNGDEPF